MTTILPVEEGRAFGTKYFDPVLIDQFNKIIRHVADERNIQVIDLHGQFQKFKKYGFTIDGVHPTAESYKFFFKSLVSGLKISDLCCGQ